MKKKERKDKTRYRSKIRKQREKAGTGASADEEEAVREAAASRLKQKLYETSGKEHKIVRDSSLDSMSDIILKYAEPFLDTVARDDKAAYEKAIMISVTLWNYSIMQERQKGRWKLKKMMKLIMANAESKTVVNYMLERKHQMYPENKRLILNYELSELSDSFHLSVASTVPEEAAERFTKDSQYMT